MGDGNNEAQQQPRKKQTSGEDEKPAIWTGYGKLVKFFRRKAKLTREQLAEAIGYSVEQVASVEQGRRPAKEQFTEAAERAMNAGGVLMELQSEVDRAKLPQFFQNFALIETEAVSRFEFDPMLVPGLLQSEGYARALFAAHCPIFDEETIELHTEARLSRQKLLTKSPPVQLSFIVSESALRNPVGGPEVLRGQLEHLLDVGKLRTVEIQVMPETGGFHPGLDGAFVLLETLRHQHVGYIESQEVGLVITDPAKVSAFGLRYGRLRSQALNVEESARFIHHLAGES